MLQKKWIVTIFISLVFFAYVIPSIDSTQAACTAASCTAACRPRSGACRSGACLCTVPQPTITASGSVCEGWSACKRDGAKCYQSRWCKKNGVSVGYQISECACPGGGGGCVPRALDCSNACGQPRSCISDGCGGQTCCNATLPCTPTIPPACVDSDGGSAPNVYGHVTISAPALPQVLYDTCLLMVTNGNSSGWVAQATGTHVGEKTCANVATGAYTDSVVACPNGCINGACSTVVNPCPKRPQGDANCDQSIDDGDFAVIKLKMRGGTYTAANHSADFNNDGKVDLVDYEIWRNTAKH